MTQPHHLWPDVEVDGSALSGAVASLLEQVVVDHHQHLPDMFAISFHAPARDVISQLHVNIGSTVTIKMTPPGGSPKTLIKGEVTGFEAEYDATRLRTILRGYDLSHRLHRGRQTQTYKNVTDSDIARQVAQRASLQLGQIDSTSVTFDHVSQANQSDWDFLKARAREIGFEMGMEDGKYYFRQPVQASGAPQAGDYQNHTDPLPLGRGDGQSGPQGGQHRQRRRCGRPFRGAVHAQRRASRVRRKRLSNPFRDQRTAGSFLARPRVTGGVERACLRRRPADQRRGGSDRDGQQRSEQRRAREIEI